MNKEELKQLLKEQTETLMEGIGEMFQAQDKKMLNMKQEILDKVDVRIGEAENRLAARLVAKEEFKQLEARVTALEG